jgi:hypothetical protein
MRGDFPLSFSGHYAQRDPPTADHDPFLRDLFRANHQDIYGAALAETKSLDISISKRFHSHPCINAPPLPESVASAVVHHGERAIRNSLLSPKRLNWNFSFSRIGITIDAVKSKVKGNRNLFTHEYSGNE